MTIGRRGWLGAVALAAMWLASGSALAGEDGGRAKGDAKGAAAKTQKVNINEASRAELMKLEGVGAGAADRIIAYREQHGPFKRVQDLDKVDKVGKTVLERNAGRLAVK